MFRTISRLLDSDPEAAMLLGLVSALAAALVVGLAAAVIL